MNGPTILCKTRKGVDELAQRTGTVPQKLRSVLILVDGKTRYADLVQKCSFITQCDKHLDWLLQHGFVEAMPPVPGALAPPQPIRVDTVFDIRVPKTGSSKAALLKMAQELLGTHADSVVQRLQDTDDTREALTQAVERCHKLIRLSIDEEKAEQFRKRGYSLLEPAHPAA